MDPREDGVDWYGDIWATRDLTPEGLAGPALLDKVEQSFWLDLLRSPVLDAIEEQGVEVRRYGPVLVTVVLELGGPPIFNNVLGAAAPGAVEGGHLERALEWVESLGIGFHVPVTLEREGAGAAEDLLNQRGYGRGKHRVRFARAATPPTLPEPEGIEVLEVDEFTEGFGAYPVEAFGLDLIASSFLDCLPGRESWRCYVALDTERPVASGSTMIHWEVARLGLTGTVPSRQRQGAHRALLHRRMLDVSEMQRRCHTVYAETEEAPDDIDGPSPAARNLVRAGFKQVASRPVWVPGCDEEDEHEYE